MAADIGSSRDRQWYIVGRWQQYAGEGRANLLRIIAVGAFYLVQLIHYHGLSAPTEVEVQFHRASGALAIAWTVLSLAVMLCLRRRVFPAALKYVSTGCDLVLLAALANIGDKAHSPLVFAFFLIIALAGLRFSLELVWFATLGAMLGYLFLVGQSDKQWFDEVHQVPVVKQLVVLLSLGLTGIMMGQVIRRVRALADDYLRRVTAVERKESP